MAISPEQAFARSRDVFLGVLEEKVGPVEVPRNLGRFHDSELRLRFRLLASWKGFRGDTLTVLVGGEDYPYLQGGVYLVYGWTDREGHLRTDACIRTREISQVREDSLALGPPAFDRLEGRKWSSFGPPLTCPVHQGMKIKASHEWPASGLTPDARREFPEWAAREAPYSGMPLAPVGWKGGSVGHAYVCPMCREFAKAWIGTSQERSTGPEDFWELPLFDARAERRTEADYRREFPRNQFAIQYGDGRNSYDSIESRFGREFGGVRDTSMKFELSKEQLDRIYEATVDARLMDVGAPHPTYPAGRGGVPVRTDRARVLFVRCGIVVRQFSWYEERSPQAPTAHSEWGRLLATYHEVQRALAERPEVRALPRIPATLDDPLRVVAQR